MPTVSPITGEKVKSLNEVSLRGRNGRLALQGWAAVGASNRNSVGTARRAKLSDAHVKAMKRAGIDPNARELVIKLPSRASRALAVNQNTAGGYTVAEDFGPAVERALVRFTPIRERATVIGTRTGAPMPWPTVNDANNQGAIVVENQPLGTQDVTYGQVVFQSYKFSSKIVLAPNELLEDAPEFFVRSLADVLGQRIGLAENQQFTTGSGSGAPTGLLSQATKGAQASGQTSIVYDDLLALLHAVDPVYRLPGQLPCWQMNDAILKLLHGLKDGAGRYICWPGVAAGDPWKLLGYEVVTNLHMPATLAAGTKSVLFGAFPKVTIRDVKELRLRRLGERYADADQTAFIALHRSDMVLLDAGSHPVQYLQH
jgi:HK97 family phage major capsid protein